MPLDKGIVVETYNSFPMRSGLASSASGSCALVLSIC